MLRFPRLFDFSCPSCGRMLRFRQLSPRFQCRVCGAHLRSNAGWVRLGLTASVIAVLACVVLTGLWQAIFIAIAPVWAFRRYFTKVELDN